MELSCSVSIGMALPNSPKTGERALVGEQAESI